MAQVLAMNTIRPEPLSPVKAQRYSSGRGGSGNIRRQPAVSTVDSARPRRTPDSPPKANDIPWFSGARGGQSSSAAQPRDGAAATGSTSTLVVKKQLTSSGRGGSGNIQVTSPTLEAHPLTAFILREHSELEALREERVRKMHADANVIRSSGRGGSGNISHPRRRSVSQETGSPKQQRLLTKIRKRASDVGDAMRARDRLGFGLDRRASRSTYSSSGGSSSAGTVLSSSASELEGSDAVTSNDSVLSDSQSRDDGSSVFTGRWFTKSARSSLFRLSRASSPSVTSLVSVPAPAAASAPATSCSTPVGDVGSRPSSGLFSLTVPGVFVSPPATDTYPDVSHRASLGSVSSFSVPWEDEDEDEGEDKDGEYVSFLEF